MKTYWYYRCISIYSSTIGDNYLTKPQSSQLNLPHLQAQDSLLVSTFLAGLPVRAHGCTEGVFGRNCHHINRPLHIRAVHLPTLLPGSRHRVHRPLPTADMRTHYQNHQCLRLIHRAGVGTFPAYCRWGPASWAPCPHQVPHVQ